MNTRARLTAALAATSAFAMIVGILPAGEASAAGSTDAVTHLPGAKRLSAFRNTYWYVPHRYLRGYQRVPGSSRSKPVVDQTVWHIKAARKGYLFGCSYRSTDRGATWTTSTIVGSVSPRNHVTMGFYTDIVTVGQGMLLRRHGHRYFLMQVAGGPAKDGVIHWAYMARARRNSRAWNHLPGTGGQTIPSVDTGC